MQKTQQFGIHLMVDGYGASPVVLRDKIRLKEFLENLPSEMGMYKICDPVIVEVGPNNHKDPGGISGFVMIAESHISFHTFPNREFVTLDIYTCQNEIDSDGFLEKFSQFFAWRDCDFFVQKRGLRYPADNLV